MKRLLGVATVVGVTLGIAAQPAGAAFPGASGAIAFTRVKFGPFGGCGLCIGQIYAIQPGGGPSGPLTDSERDKRAPTFSADGRRIVFAQQRPGAGASHIAVMDADGGHLRQLTDGHGSDTTPHFRPDGRRIAFSRWREGHGYGVYVMRADGTHVSD